MPISDSGIIRVSAVVLRDEAGLVLTVRKIGTARFMFPGGKPEQGESAEQAAVRECEEELRVHLDRRRLHRLGIFRATAANEAGYVVEATVFCHPTVSVVAPAAEIAELRWLDITTLPWPDDLAPLLSEQVIPALSRTRGAAG